MKRIFLLSLLVLATACAVAGPGRVGIPIPGTDRMIVPQDGVELEIFNNCTQHPGRAYPSTGDAEIVPSARATYLFVPYTAGGAQATYFVYGSDGSTVRGTISRSFTRWYTPGRIRTVQWIIGGNAAGSGQGIVIDHVKGVC